MSKNDNYTKWLILINSIAKLPFGPNERYLNEEGRLHRDDGPAYVSPTRLIHYKNGKKHGLDVDIYGTVNYYYENIRVPKHYFVSPDSLTLAEVLQHPNQEVRYVGLKAIGFDKVMKEANIIHVDDNIGSVLFQINGVFEDPITIVKVVNSTKEPDGTYKNYYLIVPPDIRTCKQAIAWTFRKEESDYAPVQET